MMKTSHNKSSCKGISRPRVSFCLVLLCILVVVIVQLLSNNIKVAASGHQQQLQYKCFLGGRGFQPSSLLQTNEQSSLCECREGYYGPYCEHTNCTLLENCSIRTLSQLTDRYMLYLDNTKLHVMEDNSNSIIHSSSVATKTSSRESDEIVVESPNVIASYLSQDDELYQLVESKGVHLINKYSLEANSKSILNMIITPSSFESKFINIFHSKSTQRVYLIELDAEEGRIILSTISLNSNIILNHGSLLMKDLRSMKDLSCTFKTRRNSVECMVREDEKLKIVEISINQDSFKIVKETFYPLIDCNEFTLFNGPNSETRVVLTHKREGVMVIYSILPDSLVEIGKTSSIEIIEHYDTQEDSFLFGNDQMIIIPKSEQFSIVSKKKSFNGHVIRRISPRITSIESKEYNPELSSINIKMKGMDLFGHLIGVSYSTNCATLVQHSRFHPSSSCSEGYKCVAFNYGYNRMDCSIEEEKIALKFISPLSNRNVRSKFLNQFQSINDVYSKMIPYDTKIPLTTGAPLLSIVNNAQGTCLKAVSTFNSTTSNERRSLLSIEDNIISDVVAFADFILDDLSMGNSFELWLMSTDGKYYLQAQVSQFGVGKPVRIQIYPNLPGDIMTATRKSELETDRKICNEVKTNTLYRLILRLTNPTFSQTTGQPLWTYHASIVEPTTAELEVCSLEADSTMKKANYETIQDTKFAVGISQSAYSKLFSSSSLTLNVTAIIRAVGLRCQSEDCNQIYIVPSLNDIIIISATLGSSLLFVLLVICLMISIIICIIRPWHIELTEEQKKEMELRRNFERLQQLQRTMSLGHAHSPVRSLASSNRFQQQQQAMMLMNNSNSNNTIETNRR